MDNSLPASTDPEFIEAQKRVRKIKRFYKGLAQWAGTSLFLLAINFFTSGGITWAIYPVFFWGISILMGLFEIIRLQKQGKDWEKRQLEKQLGRELPADYTPMTKLPREETKDYTDELLKKEKAEREIADLSEVRKLKRPWKDEDLV